MMETLTTSTEDESRELVLAAGRIRAQRSRERRKAKRALERSNLEDGLIEAAVCRAFIDTRTIKGDAFIEWERVFRSVTDRAILDLKDLGVANARVRTMDRMRHLLLTDQPPVRPSSSRPSDTPVTRSVRSNSPADRIADPEQNEERA